MSGIKVGVGVDTGPIKQAFAEVVAAGQKATQSLSGAKVKIDAKDAKQTIDQLNAAIESFSKSLEEAGQTDIGDAGLSGLLEQFEEATKDAQELATALQKAGVQGVDSFGKTTNSVRTMVREFERAQRLQRVLQREGISLSQGQARNAEREFQRRIDANVPGSQKYRTAGGLGAVVENWRDMAMNETDARRKRRELLSSLGINNRTLPPAPGAGSGGRLPGEPSSVVRASFGRFMGDSALRAGRGMVGAALPVGGIGGSIFRGSVSEAAATEGGMLSGAGLARLGVGAGIAGLAYGGIKAIGAVHSKITSAEGESAGYADMLRSMGGAASDFERLRDSVRGATSGMGLAYEEAQQLAKSYQHAATGISIGDLGKEVRGAVGFSRSFGLDPSQGVDFFGSMRQNKVTANDADNRRIAMMLADAIGRAGVFNKADQVLAAVSGYATQATRASFSTANVDGYVGGMSSLLGTKMAGMDPAAAASLLGRADGAIRSGGSLATQNFMLGLAQQASPDMLATDMGFLRDQGAFGSMRSAFGKGSAAYRMAESSGDKSLMARYERMAKDGGDTTTIERILKGAKAVGAGTSWTKENIKSVLGFSDSEAAAFMAADANGGIGRAVAGFKSRSADVNPGSLNAYMVSQYGTHADRLSQVKYLQGLGGEQKLSNDEAAKLRGAMASPGENDSRLKSVLADLVSRRDMQETEGDRSRQSMKDVENAITQFATKLIPLTVGIREGVVALAKRFGGYHDIAGNVEAAQIGLDTKLKDSSSPQARRAAIGSLLAKVKDHPDDYSPEFRDKLQKLLDDEGAAAPGTDPGQGSAERRGDFRRNPKLEAQARQAKKASPYDPLFQEAAARYGVDWHDLKEISSHESLLNAGAVNYNKNGTVDRGLMQLNSRFDEERGVANPFDPRENVMAGAGVWARALKAAKGNKRDAYRRYNGSGPAAEAYADEMMTLSSMVNDGGGMPLPAGASAASGSPATFHSKHEITLLHPDGKPAAAPFFIASQGQFGAPAPQGVRR